MTESPASTQPTRKILGLDIGVASIGWSIILENEDFLYPLPEDETDPYYDLEGPRSATPYILGIGVRIVPMDKNLLDGFEKGTLGADASSATKTPAADRRRYRSMRRNLQRWKQRRNRLVAALRKAGLLPHPLAEAHQALATGMAPVELYGLRARAADPTQKLTPEDLARVLVHINQRRGFKSSRKADAAEAADKEATEYKKKMQGLHQQMHDAGQTPGQYFYECLRQDPHYRVRNQVLMREDVVAEFNHIWDAQAPHFPGILTPELRKHIRDEIIFFQRPLKSARHLVGYCSLEPTHEVTLTRNGVEALDPVTGLAIRKTVGRPCAPVSHPVAQEFRIWQTLNSIKLTDRQSGETDIRLTQAQMQLLATELRKTETFSVAKLAKFLALTGEFRTNYDRMKVDKAGNKATNEGKLKGNETLCKIRKALESAGHPKGHIDTLLNDPERTIALWHAIYSIDEPEGFKKAMRTQFGFNEEEAKALANIGFKQDRMNLSVKAMNKLLPHLKAGLKYDEAVQAAGYGHHSDKRQGGQQLMDLEKIGPVPHNSMRNPVVEKMVNEVLQLVKAVGLEYGRPDEIRIELARELKATKDERADATQGIKKNEDENDKARNILRRDYNIQFPSRNDVIKYRLWQESGQVSVYTGQSIPSAQLFNRNAIEIEHIVPKSRRFDDSFANKTLAETAVNRAKGNMTAAEFIQAQGGSTIEGGHRILTWGEYQALVENRFKFKRGKLRNLVTPEPSSGFINRQLNETRFITRALKAELGKIVGYHKTTEDGREVLQPNIVVTTGSITDHLRHIWGVEDIIRELQRSRWEAMGKITPNAQGSGDHTREVWDGFSKRVDHRNHALDALIVACTRRSIVQQLNTANARNAEVRRYAEARSADRKAHRATRRLPQTLRVQAPWPAFPADARDAIRGIAVSFKSRERLLTRKKNYTRHGTPQQTYAVRQPLHEETLYGKIKDPSTRQEAGVVRKALSPLFTNAADIVDDRVRALVQHHLGKHGNDPKKAFKPEVLDADPIWLNEEQGIRVKKVRIYSRANEGLVPLEGSVAPDGTKGRRGWVNPGNNILYALYGHALPTPGNKKRGTHHGQAISAFEAVQTARQHDYSQAHIVPPTAGQGLPLLYTLRKNQMVVRYDQSPDEIDWDNQEELVKRLWVMRKSTGSAVFFVRHHLSGIDPGKPNTKDDAWNAAPSTLYAVPVTVSILGHIIPRPIGGTPPPTQP